MELFEDYEIVADPDGGQFYFRHKNSGTTLLATQYVSLSTLVRLALEDEVVVDG